MSNNIEKELHETSLEICARLSSKEHEAGMWRASPELYRIVKALKPLVCEIADKVNTPQGEWAVRMLDRIDRVLVVAETPLLHQVKLPDMK